MEALLRVKSVFSLLDSTADYLLQELSQFGAGCVDAVHYSLIVQLTIYNSRSSECVTYLVTLNCSHDRSMLLSYRIPYELRE